MTNATTQALITTTQQIVVGTMSEDMFGAIAVNNFGWQNFEDHIEDFGLTNIRWPGGTVAETGWVVDGRIRMGGGEVSLDTLDGDRSHFAFDLTHPELISELALQYDELNHLARDDVGTFSQVLARAVENGVDVELIIPIERYYVNQDLSDAATRERAIEAAVSDITVFLDRLKNGEFNNGDLPGTIIFDIGNEQYSNPVEMAIIGKAIIDTIAEILQNSGVSYEIAWQMGRGEFEYDNLVEAGYFEPFFDGGDIVPGFEDLDWTPGVDVPQELQNVFVDMLMIEVLGDSLVHIDGLRNHTLGFSSDDLDGENAPLWQRAEIRDYWIGEFEALGVDPEDIEYIMSSYTTNTSNGNSLPYELSGAANLLEMFDYMMLMGVDRAYIWGVVGAFRYKEDMLTTTVSDRLSDFDSPQAAILTLLSQNVMNSDYIGSAGGDAEGYHSFTFESDSEYTVFLYVEDVNNGEFTLDVDLGLFGDLQTISVLNLDIADGALNGASQLTDSQLSVLDGMVQISFDQNFEIVMLTLQKGESITYQTIEFVEAITQTQVVLDETGQGLIGSNESDDIVGEIGSDFLFGMGGDDVLNGGTGRAGFLTGNGESTSFSAPGGNNGDFIFGGGGDDVLRGNAGNDLLSGDEGNDELWGGGGFDTFIFTEGMDTICDFDVGVDTIIIDALLLDQNQDFGSWLGNNTVTVGNALVIDFGVGNALTVRGLSDVDELINSIQVVEDAQLFV